MTSIHILCEGQTEERFVKELLVEPFKRQNIFITVSLIGKPGQKGGNVTFGRLLTDIRIFLNNKTSYCTTFFDFYGLPMSFPGKSEAASEKNISNKAAVVCKKLVEQLTPEIGDAKMRRFIPYVQMHEFEALLFSDPSAFANAVMPKLEAKFIDIRRKFASPEAINDSPDTAPSKRIKKLIPSYEKPANGISAALEIGLSKIRSECPLFNGWLTHLEQLDPIP